MTQGRLLAIVATLLLLGPLPVAAGPLHVAAENGDVERVKTLLVQGEDINARDENEATPLHWAVYAGHEAVARLLIAAGADVFANESQFCLLPFMEQAGGDASYSPIAVPPSGVTPLHWAASGGHTALAEMLLAKGANVNARTLEGLTPLAVARGLGYTEMAQLLESRGGSE